MTLAVRRTQLEVGNICEHTHGGSEGHHDIPAEICVLEHAFKLIGELAATLRLQLGDHVLLGISAGASTQQQALGQILLVEGLKHILTLHDMPGYVHACQHFSCHVNSSMIQLCIWCRTDR